MNPLAYTLQEWQAYAAEYRKTHETSEDRITLSTVDRDTGKSVLVNIPRDMFKQLIKGVPVHHHHARIDPPAHKPYRKHRNVPIYGDVDEAQVYGYICAWNTLTQMVHKQFRSRSAFLRAVNLCDSWLRKSMTNKPAVKRETAERIAKTLNVEFSTLFTPCRKVMV